MNLADLLTPLSIVAVASIAAATLVWFIRDSRRFSSMQMAELLHQQEQRREEADRRARAEFEFSRRQQEQEEPLYFSTRVGPIAPAVAGDYLTFNYDRGSNLSASEFEDMMRVALYMPKNLAFIYGDSDDLSVRVNRVTYRNPLDLVLLVLAGGTVLGGLVLGARRVNHAVQEIRRTHAQTATIKAGLSAQARRSELAEELYGRLTESVAEEDEELLREKLRRLHLVAEVATTYGLISVTHTEVSELESRAPLPELDAPNQQEPRGLLGR